MKRKKLLLIELLLIIICFVTLIVKGTSYTITVPINTMVDNVEDFQIEIKQDKEIVRLTERRLEDGTLYVSFRSVSAGSAYVEITGPDDYFYMDSIYVHSFGIITVGNYFGKTEGSFVIPVSVVLYLLIILWSLIRQYCTDMRNSIYKYRNIRNLGWIIYGSFMLLRQIPYILSKNELLETVRVALESASELAFIAFPVAFVVSILVAVSNIQLMCKEGRNWRNMIGLMLCMVVCFGTILPALISEILHGTMIVDVHNEQGVALYVEMAVTNTILVAVSYLECILWSTITLGIKAAKKIPAFDKDYILILGCQIKKDGTLTPLLKGRADRALEFAHMQKEATGKELLFVPSGGKGDDEVISEAEAIRNYLVDTGVEKERILVENRSVNTYENLKNSMELIRKETDISEPKIAFSTTNYHVFRAGILAGQQGIHMEGIGSRTRSYFWINAFVREFIATVYSERKTHLKIITVMILVMLIMIYMVYLSNVL